MNLFAPTPDQIGMILRMAGTGFGPGFISRSMNRAFTVAMDHTREALTTPAVHKPPVLIRWHGGKYLRAPWIIEHFPAHDCYTESYGGGGSVLLQKQRSRAEVYNDLDQEVVALFRILGDAAATDKLADLVWLTPFSRDALSDAYKPGETDIEKALKLLTRSFMGFSPTASTRKRQSGLATSTAPGKYEPNRWLSVPDTTRILVERMRGVMVENKPALAVMAKHDTSNCLHYVDPPYTPGSRGKGDEVELKADYRHEMTLADHRELLAFLKTLKGYVVLSGYASELYDTELADWMRTETTVTTQDNTLRTEVLWINPHAEAALRDEGKLGAGQPDLFA